MANTLANVPVSKIIKNKSNFEDEPKKKSREDWRKAKELEEARKAGTAPAAVDEEGKDINPHIPQYISATPWYFGAQVCINILKKLTSLFIVSAHNVKTYNTYLYIIFKGAYFETSKTAA